MLEQNKQIKNIILEHIQNGTTAYNNLDSVDQGVLSSLAMSTLDYDSEALVECAHYNKLISAIHYDLKEQSTDSALSLAEMMRENLIDYFYDRLTSAFEEILSEYENDIRVGKRLKPSINQQTGEIEWM